MDHGSGQGLPPSRRWCQSEAQADRSADATNDDCYGACPQRETNGRIRRAVQRGNDRRRPELASSARTGRRGGRTRERPLTRETAGCEGSAAGDDRSIGVGGGHRCHRRRRSSCVVRAGRRRIGEPDLSPERSNAAQASSDEFRVRSTARRGAAPSAVSIPSASILGPLGLLFPSCRAWRGSCGASAAPTVGGVTKPSSRSDRQD